MSYPKMSGLELFSDPFSQPQAYNHPQSHSSSPTTPQPKTAVTQTLPDHQTAQPTQPKPATAQAQQFNTTDKKPVTPLEAPDLQEKTKSTAQEKKTKETSTPVKPPAPVDSPKSETPKQELELDMSSTDTATAKKSTTVGDTARRKAHEEAEVKRKAVWEAKQAVKKQAEEEALQKLHNMSDNDVIAASIKRVSADVERLTRRNMKECVSAHIQELARKNPDFARHTMHPRKSMINCFKYINRMAKDYVKQEMDDNDIKPDAGGYGCDVPDGIVFQWAVDYFNDPNAKEDQVKEEKFTPRPYTSTSSKPAAKTKKATTKAKKTETKKNQEPKDSNFEQISLF